MRHVAIRDLEKLSTALYGKFITKLSPDAALQLKDSAGKVLMRITLERTNQRTEFCVEADRQLVLEVAQ